MKNILAFLRREPLMLFLAAAIVLFAANRLIHGPERSAPGDVITISQGRVQQLAQGYELLAGRAPSRTELQSLVDDFVTEEVNYREAVAMGLDADDTIVRRRMRQKLEFLVEDTAASSEPTDADLQAWLTNHADQYRLSQRVAFQQVLASGDKRGTVAATDAKAMLVKLETGAEPSSVGDGSMLPGAVPLTTKAGVAALFGDDFASAVFAHEGSGWFGPVSSPFGQHLVRATDKEAESQPSFAEVREKVKSDWIENRRDQARDDFQARMRKRYQIQIEWPKGYEGLPTTPEPAPKTRRVTDAGGE